MPITQQPKEIIMYPLISVQILNWNRAEESIRAITSAINQTYSNIEIVVVDNGSSDNSVKLIAANFPKIKLIKLDKNYGCPGGRNKGVEHCNGDFIFYLDNDGVLHENAVLEAYNSIKENNNIGIVAGVIYDYEKKDEINTSILPKSNKTYLFNNFQGGICLHRKSIYSDIGYYPSHFMYGGEEAYLTYKLVDKNYIIIKNESVILWHKRSDIARDRTNELLNSFFNKLYVAVNLFPIKQTILFTLYFPLQYYKYAKLEKINKEFLNSLKKRYFLTIKKALDSRNSVKTKSYHFINNFRSN